jgi:hypothetical protein
MTFGYAAQYLGYIGVIAGIIILAAVSILIKSRGGKKTDMSDKKSA